MKLLTRSLSLLTIVALGLFLANCGPDGGEKSSKEKTQFNKLKGTWKLGTVTLEGVTGTPEQIDEDDFRLTISGNYDANNPQGQFNVAGTESPSPLPASGNWTLESVGSGNTGIISLGPDEIIINYTFNSEGDLSLMFNLDGDGYPGAKKMAVEGDWTFVLEKVN